MPIDYVIPYVNMEDPEWQKLYRKYVRTNPAKRINRYRDFGTLKYQFRGIEKNMPWIRYVYLVVQSESQIPEWLNRKHPKLKIIFHKDYIPKRFLPTFNSNVIEMWYQNIPGLSKTFILSNDDLIPIKPTPEEFYFRNGKPVYSIHLTSKNWTSNSRSVIAHIVFNSVRLSSKLAKKKTLFKYSQPHLLIPHSLDVINEVWKKAKFPLLNSMDKSRVRTINNYNHWLYEYYGVMTGKAIADENVPHDGYFQLEDNSDLEKIKTIISKAKVICCNDGIKDNISIIAETMKLIEKELPSKSSFEV
jgi:hypothetical protein